MSSEALCAGLCQTFVSDIWCKFLVVVVVHAILATCEQFVRNSVCISSHVAMVTKEQIAR